MSLLRLVVERLAHDAEVLLRRVGAAVALGGRAVGDVVEQRLRGRADHRDDVGAGLGRGARLIDVVVDVAGGDDDVLVRRRRHRELALERVALVDAPAGARRRPARASARTSSAALPPLRPTAGPACSAGSAAMRSTASSGLAAPSCSARPYQYAAPLFSTPAACEPVDHQVDQRSAPAPRIGHPEAAQHGALDRDGGVPVDAARRPVDDLRGDAAGLGDLRVVDEGPWHDGSANSAHPRPESNGHAGDPLHQRSHSHPGTALLLGPTGARD